MKQVIKRNGKRVKFDKEKIIVAVEKAFKEVDGEITNKAHQKAEEIANFIEAREAVLSVEEIQDIVEDKLMASNRKDVARAYVRYRYKKEVLRKENTTDKTIFELLGGTSEYWNNENANKNAKSVTTQRDYLAGITSTDITRRFLLDKDIVEAHDNGIIHFHDADYFVQNVLHNCFDVNTKFITSEGVKSFSDFQENDEIVVLTHTGEWKKAIVKNYGKQDLYRITFKRKIGRSKDFLVTKNHRWILEDGNVTTKLKVGDTLIKTPTVAAIDFSNTSKKQKQSYGNWKVKNIQFEKNDNVWCLEVEDNHSFILDGGVVTGNCELVNLDDMLQNGTVVNGVMIEKPHRLITAATIATQVILAVTSSSYGGCTVSLTHLAPFVRDSYNKYYKKYIDNGIDEETAKKLSDIDTKKEVADAVQTFNYQVNSMTNTNGQAPFLSVCMYLGETDEYKEELAMLIEEFLKQRMLGFKNEQGVYVTPAFPKLLYVLEEDNINPNGKYYYLTKLAAECTAKRMVPDYISEKIMLENKIDGKGRGNCYPCMGCRSFLTPDRFQQNLANAKNYIEGKSQYYGRLIYA